MHLIGRVCNRFLEIFFIKKVKAEGVRSGIQQVAVRGPSKPRALRPAFCTNLIRSNGFSAVVSLPTRAVCGLAAVTVAACAGPVAGTTRTLPAAGVKTVYVVHHGSLHTGLTLKRSDLRRGILPAGEDYGRSKYIEVGWGDDDGYRKPLTSAIALKALFGSRRTVLLTSSFNEPPRRKYADPKFTVLAVDLSAAGFDRLCQHVDETCARDMDGRVIPLGDGWYRARGTYSAFNTCNTWIAVGLGKAGCPISPAFCSLPKQLLSRVRPFARVIKAGP